MTCKVLIIEDQREIADLVKLHLGDIDCDTKFLFDGIVGLVEAEANKYDLIILDLRLPGEGGLDICRRLRSCIDSTPVLTLTSRASELDRILSLEIGADDYLTKPFSVLELRAKVEAIFRHVEAIANAGINPNAIIRAGDMVIDTDQRSVTLCGQEINLTPKEFDLLLHLAQNPGRVYTREQLLDFVWGFNYAGYRHTVNSHINRLRSKIETDPANPTYVLTVWGVGYKFSETAGNSARLSAAQKRSPLP
ncbi:response regulator transcription factor [Methyloferula stellata]|uniref:response regulator transcription factor n=1 Tax=Methyloferula stellata TaxID=876270 RepID=UPI00036A7A46|nr:response regulator transcription factor [Methyloferula stellata]